MTSPFVSPITPEPAGPLSDPDDPLVAAEAASQAMRDQLTRRINAHAYPSRLINQIVRADARIDERAKVLAHLIGRSPKVLTVIRTALREAFALDPDTLLFTEPKPPSLPNRVDSLTDRALQLLVMPTVVINLNQFTALSIKDEPNSKLPYTPLDAIRRVIAMRLPERLAYAATAYWDTLAQGSWRTRRELWVEQHKELFADRAFLARQLDELSTAAMTMVKALIDAPTASARQRAGGQWASVRVGQLMWPGTPAVIIPGALHLFCEGDPTDTPHVMYLPGVARNFYEYSSFEALQCGALELGNSRFHDLWQCLPLSRRNTLCRPAQLPPMAGIVRGLEVLDDALAVGAQALLTGQWSNELACAVKINEAFVFSTVRPRPQPPGAESFLTQVEGARRQLIGTSRLSDVGDQLLIWDRQRRHEEIIFGSAVFDLALGTAERQAKRYEKGLVALLTPDDPSADTVAYNVVLLLGRQIKEHTQALNALLQDAGQRLLELAFWVERPGGAGTPRRASLFIHAQTEALRHEVELHYRLKLIHTAHRDLMTEVLNQPLPTKRAGSETRVLSIAVGSEPDAFCTLLNVWVVTTAAAVRVPTRQHAVVLYAFGKDGGVLAFAGLDALTRSLKASLRSLDDSVLWGCVDRDKRADLRRHAARETLGVRYVEMNGKPALMMLKKLLGSCDRLLKSREDITRIFSEVTDAEVSRSLLILELEDQLKVPANNAFSQAQANVELLRTAHAQAKQFPPWLIQATRVQRKHFKHWQRVYLISAFAFNTRLEHDLPDLETFARRRLITRLGQDGFPADLDIDLPFIEMPDDVSGSFCGWYSSSCPVGDRSIKYTPSATRTTFSLLQLTLHNLDPLAPWTRWRLNRARYLQPDWKKRLNADYLISMVSSLDIGGQYDALINEVFYPRADAAGRIPRLLNRTLRAGFKYHLFCAIQQGLTPDAQSIFNTAMAARTPQDLLKNQHQLQLHVVYLVGHTMKHDRYIAGIVVVQDKHSELCVVYWPEAPGTLALTEYNSLQQATEALNRLGALPENLKALAQQVAPGWAFEALPLPVQEVDLLAEAGNYLYMMSPGSRVRHAIVAGLKIIRSFSIKHLEPAVQFDEIEAVVREQIASDPQAWLAVTPIPHSDTQALLFRASVFGLQSRTQAMSHSGKALEQYRASRLGEQSEARARALVGLIFPFYALFNDFYELLLVSRRYHHYGDPNDAAEVAFRTTFLVIDILMSVVPGPKKVWRGAVRVGRPALTAVLGRIHRSRMKAHTGSALPATQLTALQRFKVEGVPEGAVALRGPGESGVYVKNGELFMADDTHHYPLYRRGNEQSLRFKNTQAAGQDELILNIHEPKQWLLSADAPQPVAGPSSGVLNPWRPPVPPPPDWQPAAVRSVTEDAIRQSMATSDHWLDWRTQPQNTQMTSPAPGVFYNALDTRGYPHNLLRIAPPDTGLPDLWSGYYRLLPQGDQAPLDRIVFIHRNEPLVSSASLTIEGWTSTRLLEQPFPASRTAAGDWQIHEPLFDRPLSEYVRTAFPTMTRRSRHLAAQRMIQLADPEYSPTATHMLNVRATLDSWLPPAPAWSGQTDDLLRMLRPTDRRRRTIFISREDKASAFTRVDFRISDLDPILRPDHSTLAVQRAVKMREAITRVLQQQGFDVEEVLVMHHKMSTHELIATHPLSNSNNLYYVSVHWVYGGSIQLDTRLTNQWFNETFKRNPGVQALAGVKTAMREKRLIRIVAGIQWSNEGASRPTVYFAKVSPS
ncbi:dermonecrotic toxin domain-containing protein [Pseudomonas reactans]|uniref:dermonecrotic toxin domain-containing protein n=1 Tax=Pseudomonas reactans TaxID=117680 RepID=UPI001FE2CF22|nr:DUF6543 domain-containing protein [Pseudomonas reactans]